MWIAECVRIKFILLDLSRFVESVVRHTWLLVHTIPGQNFPHFYFTLQNDSYCHSAPWDKMSVNSIIHAKRLKHRLFVRSFVCKMVTQCNNSKWHLTFDVSYHCIIIFAEFFFVQIYMCTYCKWPYHRQQNEGQSTFCIPPFQNAIHMIRVHGVMIQIWARMWRTCLSISDLNINCRFLFWTSRKHMI